MSQNSKSDLGKVLSLILGGEKCLLNCTPDARLQPLVREVGERRPEAVPHRRQPPLQLQVRDLVFLFDSEFTTL